MTDLRKSFYILFFLAAACAPDHEAASGSIAADENTSQIDIIDDVAAAAIEANREDLIAFRRDLHRNPELSNEEQRTAGKVAGRLKELGFEVAENIGGYGVVGVLHGARPGPVVAFRADMDAVRSDAPDPAPFASERAGIRHICGHDIHMTIAIALAEAFAASRDNLSGSVMLIFQPAEETTNGARDMLADGVFNDLRPDAIFAYHTAPPETGMLVTANARLMAARDLVEIAVSGSDQNEAIAAEIGAALSTLSNVDSPFASQPADSDFIHAGPARPRIDDEGVARINAYLSLATAAASANAEAGVERIVETARSGHPDADITYAYHPSDIPGVVNDAELTQRAVAAAREKLGQDQVVYLDTVIPAFSEDYGHFLNEAPGMMFFLGVSNSEKGWSGLPHAPDYMADEEAIFIGAETMAAIMIDYLSANTATE